MTDSDRVQAWYKVEKPCLELCCCWSVVLITYPSYLSLTLQPSFSLYRFYLSNDVLLSSSCGNGIHRWCPPWIRRGRSSWPSDLVGTYSPRNVLTAHVDFWKGIPIIVRGPSNPPAPVGGPVYTPAPPAPQGMLFYLKCSHDFCAKSSAY